MKNVDPKYIDNLVQQFNFEALLREAQQRIDIQRYCDERGILVPPEKSIHRLPYNVFSPGLDGVVQICNQHAADTQGLFIEEYEGFMYTDIAEKAGVDVSLYHAFHLADRDTIHQGRIQIDVAERPAYFPDGKVRHFINARMPRRHPDTKKIDGVVGVSKTIADVYYAAKTREEAARKTKYFDMAVKRHQDKRVIAALADDMDSISSSHKSVSKAQLVTHLNVYRERLRQLARSHEVMLPPSTQLPGQLLYAVAKKYEERCEQQQVDFKCRVTADAKHHPFQQAGDDLERLLSLLIDNSLDAMKTGGTLTVEFATTLLSSRWRQWVVSISDTGPGLDNTFQTYLMSDDSTLAHPTQRKGLTLVKRMVAELLQGRLCIAESSANGTIIQVVFDEAIKQQQAPQLVVSQ